MASGSPLVLVVSDLHSRANLVEPRVFALWNDLAGGQRPTSVHRSRENCSGAAGGDRRSRSGQDNTIRETSRSGRLAQTDAQSLGSAALDHPADDRWATSRPGSGVSFPQHTQRVVLWNIGSGH